MKEDVEDLPEKEEVVIWVELTPEQRRYYKALYAQQIGALLGGSKNLPGMRNLAMELRKLCCHPVSAVVCVSVGMGACGHESARFPCLHALHSSSCLQTAVHSLEQHSCPYMGCFWLPSA